MAYSQIEDKYLSALTAVQFPDAPIEEMAPGQQSGDVLLAAGPNAVVSDAGGAAFGIYPGMGKRSQKSDIGEKMVTGTPDFAAGAARGAATSALGFGGDIQKIGRFIGALASDNQGGDIMERLGRAAETMANPTFFPSSTDVSEGGYTIPGTNITLPGLPAAVPAGTSAFGMTPEERQRAAALGQDVGELVGDPLMLVKGGQIAVKGAKTFGKAAAEGLNERILGGQSLIPGLSKEMSTPGIMFAVPLEQFPKVTSQVAAKVDKGGIKISNKVSPGKLLQLDPEFRVKISGFKPEGKNQNITNDVNPGNYGDVTSRLDTVAQSFPDPLESPEKFSAMLATVYNSAEVPIPPRWMIDNVNDMDKWSSWFGSMNKSQIDEADRGFAVVDKFKKIYSTGEAGADTTGRLMFWAMLSRRASAYPHESGFLDLAEAMTPLIQKAVRGEYTPADVEAGLEMIKQTIPTGSPGKSVTSNANDFVKTFLTKMSERTPDNRTKLQALHDMIADPNMTGPQIRREFFGLAENVGIKNKVLSFALLVSGRDDVMVLDRIQINRLFAGGDKIYDNVAQLFDGGPGLAMYEGLERSLGKRVNELYSRVGRGDKASLGRYHWESWVLSSGQEVAHPTLDTIVKAAKGDVDPFSNVPVMEGRTHKTSYGVTYERMPDGSNQFVFPAEDGTKYAMTKPSLDALFDRVMKGKEKLVPKDFPGVNFFEKDTLPNGSPNPYFGKPWYSWPGVNRERIDELAATFGTKLNTQNRAGSLETTGASQAAGGSLGAKRASTGKRASVKRGDSAPTPGAE
jgi:hypothetical protein